MMTSPAVAPATIEARTIRKVRTRIIPFVFVLFVVAVLDRNNIGFAALTMNKELAITNQQYGFIAGIFFFGYFIFEIPSNLLLHRIGARVWIARILITCGAGSEFVLACDMRFAARESAVFGQLEAAFGLIQGAGAMQHISRLMGRGRALEVLLSAEDYDADLAERYGWVNRALPEAAIGDFVKSLAHRIASFPAASRAVIKERVNGIALAPAEEFRRDSDLFLECARNPESQRRTKAAMNRGFQTRDTEMDLDRMLGELVEQ